MWKSFWNWLVRLSKIRADQTHYLSTQPTDNIILGEE